MDRPRVVLAAIFVSSFSGATGFAQTAALAEGWVVLPVEEYRALTHQEETVDGRLNGAHHERFTAVRAPSEM